MAVPEACRRPNQVGITPLFLAVRGGHSQIVQFLCDSPGSLVPCRSAETKSEAIMIINDPFPTLWGTGQVGHSYLW